MPFIDAALADASEPQLVPEGRYDLRIIKVEDKASQSGNMMTVLTIQIEDRDQPNAELISLRIMHPAEKDEPRQKAFKLLQMRRAADCFGVPYTEQGLNTDDFLGATASEIDVRQVELPALGGRPARMQNEVQLPKLAGDTSAASPQKKGRARAGQ